MPAAVLSNIAGRVLKGPGHSQSPGQDLLQSHPLLKRATSFSSLASLGSEDNQADDYVGMVNKLGDPRVPSFKTPSWTKMRPLSDIRELTEPSLTETIPKKLLSDNHFPTSMSRPDVSRKPSVASKHRPSIESRPGENKEPDRNNSIENDEIRPTHRGRPARTPSPPSPGDNSISSIYSIPTGSVPPRSSSRARPRNIPRSQLTPIPPLPTSQRTPAPPLLQRQPIIPPPPPRGSGNTIPRWGQSQSPLRHVTSQLDPISHDTHRRIPSRTFIREPLSNELLEYPIHRHPRVHLELDLSAGIFVGGGSVEGTVQINVDDAERIRHRRTLDIARISVDLLGLEEMVGSRRSVFINLATELIDDDNPPPKNMVQIQERIVPREAFWHLVPSVTNLPFMMSLPLNIGPPPFYSRIARIRYLLCVSLLIRDQGKQYIVRTTEEISVLSVYDPEKALVSLPSPLTASDEWIKPRDVTIEAVRVTAGLHRQVWVSGTSIYVDIHIVNNSRKTIRKIELQLERDILCYKHAAASTMEKSASQARIFDSNERSVLSKRTIKQGAVGWHGVPARNTHIRTCDIEVPRGHATVKCGKFFEVRYFLNVIISSSHTKLVTVQLPVVLIHMNSLDVVPNSVAQVAAAIEEKRTAQSYSCGHTPPRLNRRPSQSVQGRAFAAPRMHSIERMRIHVEELQELGQVLGQSPQKCGPRRVNSIWDYHTPPSNRKARLVGDSDREDLQTRLRSVQSNDTIGAKGTVLRRGLSVRSSRGTTSALGFREAEVRDDFELSGLGVTSEVPFRKRLEQSRERQYRFGKKRSVERWKGVANVGVGWLKGSTVAKDERERDGWI